MISSTYPKNKSKNPDFFDTTTSVRFKFPATPADTSRMNSFILNTLRDLLRTPRDILLENLTLRQQILVLRRTNPKPPFSRLDRAFWVLLYRKWENWRRRMAHVKPETVIAWHRQGWRLWRRWKSR